MVVLELSKHARFQSGERPDHSLVLMMKWCSVLRKLILTMSATDPNADPQVAIKSEHAMLLKISMRFYRAIKFTWGALCNRVPAASDCRLSY